LLRDEFGAGSGVWGVENWESETRHPTTDTLPTTYPTAEPFIPEKPTLPTLREAVQGCRGCDLYEGATQAVFGEGMKKAKVMFVGEQPGDREDKEGRPFVGPAGRMFDKALEEAGIDRSEVYVTNVVKHFKYTMRGKRRIHQRPGAEEIRACRPWLDNELEQVKPQVLVCLGATAAKALLGPKFKVTQQRGDLIDSELAPKATATVHPSSILRAPDEDARRQAYEDFLEDLKIVATALG
jgi:uracil-DNA glycosylase